MTRLFCIGSVLLVAAGCSGIGDSECGKNGKALNDILNAGEKGFSRALNQHGKAINEDELPCIVSATNSGNPDKRRNASELLVKVRGKPFIVLGEQRAVVLETKYVDVWAKVMGFLLDPRADADPGFLASKRHDMIKEALSSNDIYLQSVALRAGVSGAYPGMKSEIKNRLETAYFDLLNTALDVLSPNNAQAELPRLLKMLADYESGAKYSGNHLRVNIFAHLSRALIRTEDSEAYFAVRRALEKRYESSKRAGVSRREYLAFQYLTKLPNSNSQLKKFCYHLIKEDSIVRPWAVSILTTQIEAGKQKPTREIVRICVEALDKKNPDNTIGCERLFEYLGTGSVVRESDGERITGTAALEIGRKWLREHE